jgi:hypothetical protein
MKNVPKNVMAGAYPGTKQQKSGTPTFADIKGKTNPMNRAKALRKKKGY